MHFADHFIKAADIAVEHFDDEAKVGGLDSNFTEHFNLQRVGVHLFVIPPGFRTSRPHAESMEDEFVFVVKGEVDLCFKGRIKKMTAGDSIGFPPGTGIGHTFINNSKSDVELFVANHDGKPRNLDTTLFDERQLYSYSILIVGDP